ncbi:alpha/beta fold hydrolase [Geodermatophilus sp. DF01-2]|nr:alpha/beta fold hydrolase [Geodermatophilus sp. DF01_2]
MTAWLAELVAALDVGPVHLVGHSAGAHLALSAGLEGSPVPASLSLLDPTACFAGFSPRYLLRALPTLVHPQLTASHGSWPGRPGVARWTRRGWTSTSAAPPRSRGRLSSGPAVRRGTGSPG